MKPKLKIDLQKIDFIKYGVRLAIMYLENRLETLSPQRAIFCQEFIDELKAKIDKIAK